MFSRILTAYERKILTDFLKEGIKAPRLAVRMWRIRKFRPQIEQDLELMRKALSKYERTKKK